MRSDLFNENPMYVEYEGGAGGLKWELSCPNKLIGLSFKKISLNLRMTVCTMSKDYIH